MNQWYDGHLILIQGTLVNALLALSIQVPLRAGVFSFAGVGFYGIGAYVSAILTIRYGWPALATIGISMVIAAVAGYLLSIVVRKLDGLYLAMATVAFVLILGVVAINGGSLTGGSSGLYGALGDLPIWLIGVMVLSAVLLAVISERGRMGRRIEVVREDPQLAAAMGINVGRVRRMSFVASGLLGACAGGVNALLRSTVSQSDLNFSLVVLALTIIIVGGARSWLGAAIGAIIFTWLPSLLSFVGQWQAIVYGVIVALAAVWVPGGMVGIATERYRSIQAKRRRALAASSATEDSPEPELATLAGFGDVPEPMARRS